MKTNAKIFLFILFVVGCKTLSIKAMDPQEQYLAAKGQLKKSKDKVTEGAKKYFSAGKKEKEIKVKTAQDKLKTLQEEQKEKLKAVKTANQATNLDQAKRDKDNIDVQVRQAQQEQKAAEKDLEKAKRTSTIRRGAAIGGGVAVVGGAIAGAVAGTMQSVGPMDTSVELTAPTEKTDDAEKSFTAVGASPESLFDDAAGSETETEEDLEIDDESLQDNDGLDWGDDEMGDDEWFDNEEEVE